MKILNIIWLLSLALILPVSAADKPNVVVIMADDLGYADVGCYGCKDIPTPHIDGLAKNGIRFTSAYVTGNMCGPSRAGFLTGRHQASFGYYKNVSEPLDPAQGLPEIDTIASLMKQQGYVTGGVGKWHMGTSDKQHPNAMGFDDWFGFLGGGLTYYPLDHPGYNGKFTPLKRPAGVRAMQHTLPVIHNRTPVKWKKYITHELTDAGINFLEKNHKQPFFLFMSYNAPHLELEAPQETIAKYPAESMTSIPRVKPAHRSIYAAMVDEMDDGIGQILAKLDALDLEKNTVVWFLSDHGGMGRTSDNRPFKGAKGTSFEGGLRVPMIVKWPKKLPKGAVLEHPVTSLDIGATSIAMAGGDPAKAGLHGKDIRPYLTGQSDEPPHKTLYWRTGTYTRKSGVIRDGDYKLMVQGKSPLLFDLKADPGETTDLAKTEPKLVQTMLEKWNEWDKATSKPDLWTGKKNAFQYADYDWLKGSQHYRDSKTYSAIQQADKSPASQRILLEGEALKITRRAGALVKQRVKGIGKENWSGDHHIWWKGAKPGDVIEFSVPVPKTGNYRIAAVMTKAKNYGIVQFALDGNKIAEPIDLYNNGVLHTGEVVLADAIPLNPGEHKLSVTMVGANPEALKKYMFGLDYISLKQTGGKK